MDTSKMLRMEYLDSYKSYQLLNKSREMLQTATALVESLDMQLISQQIIEVVENYYNLGKVTDVYEIFGGYINRSFGIYVEKNGEQYNWFLRKYSKGKQIKEILLEHNLLLHARKNGFSYGACPIKANDGKTFVKLTEGVGEGSLDWYFAVYDFLTGDEKYNWVENELTREEFTSAGEVIASFHNAVKDYDPLGNERNELPILDLLPTLPKQFKEWLAMDIDNVFHKYFADNIDRIEAVIAMLAVPAEDRAKLPVNALQCDVHPGNMKYADNKVVSVFDFDWAKVDLRVFELGLGLVYFCSSWKGELDGVLHLDRCEAFLQGYNNKLGELGDLSPLNETEKKYFPEMLNAGNIYLILWCTRAYYNDLTLNPYEYFVYLQHQVKCMNWVDRHRKEIMEMIKYI